MTKPKLGLLKEQENALRLGDKNEKEEVASLGVAFGRLSLRRMCNDSRPRRRYTEARESLEKGSFRIRQNKDSDLKPRTFTHQNRDADHLQLYFSPLSAVRAKLQSATSAIATSLEITRNSLAMPISSIIELSEGVPVSE